MMILTTAEVEPLGREASAYPQTAAAVVARTRWPSIAVPAGKIVSDQASWARMAAMVCR